MHPIRRKKTLPKFSWCKIEMSRILLSQDRILTTTGQNINSEMEK